MQNLWVFPEITGSLPSLGDEQNPISLQWCVRGVGEVDVVLTDLKTGTEENVHNVNSVTSGFV